MANLTLDLNIYSAKDLENVNIITKMDVYAVVSITGDDSQKNHKEKTAVNRTGDSEPTWNHAVKFSVDQRLAREGRLTLVVKLVCDRIFGDKDLGEVQVPILELLNSSPSVNGDGNGQGMRFVTYQVRTPFGKGQGSLTFSYRFDSLSFKPDLPVYSNPVHTLPDFPRPSETGFYPPLPQPPVYSAPPYPYPHPHPNQYDSATVYPPSTSGTDIYPPPYPSGSNYPPSSSDSNIYPPPPPHHPYLYPPPPDKPSHSYHQMQPSQSFHGFTQPPPLNLYGYPPSSTPGYGHGCPPSHTPPKNKPGVGLGLGAGLVGGALGGLLLGDIVSDIGFDF